MTLKDKLKSIGAIYGSNMGWCTAEGIQLVGVIYAWKAENPVSEQIEYEYFKNEFRHKRMKQYI